MLRTFSERDEVYNYNDIRIGNLVKRTFGEFVEKSAHNLLKYLLGSLPWARVSGEAGFPQASFETHDESLTPGGTANALVATDWHEHP